MSDIFSLKTVPITEELGMALKNFRIENKVTAKSITTEFDRASSYISKLEKGDIKKIEGDFLIQLCNYITRSENGIARFMEKLAPNFLDFSPGTQIIIMNIDDLLLEHQIPDSFIKEITDYLNIHKITIQELTKKINDNETIRTNPGYDNAPKNEWYAYGNDIDNAIIKLSIPQSYVEDLLSKQLSTIHSVIAEAILYSMYRLGMDDEREARDLAHSKLTLYHILRIRGGNIIRVNDSNFESLFGGLEPDVADALKGITSGLKLITTLTKKDGYGKRRIKQIHQNMREDLGFYFAYMSLNLEELENKSKNKKQSFLDELKVLIDKYSQDNNSLDIYD